MEKEDGLIEKLKLGYCNFCQSHDLKITRTIKIECKKCGKTRVIQSKL